MIPFAKQTENTSSTPFFAIPQKGKQEKVDVSFTELLGNIKSTNEIKNSDKDINSKLESNEIALEQNLQQANIQNKEAVQSENNEIAIDTERIQKFESENIEEVISESAENQTIEAQNFGNMFLGNINLNDGKLVQEQPENTVLTNSEIIVPTGNNSSEKGTNILGYLPETPHTTSDEESNAISQSILEELGFSKTSIRENKQLRDLIISKIHQMEEMQSASTTDIRTAKEIMSNFGDSNDFVNIKNLNQQPANFDKNQTVINNDLNVDNKIEFASTEQKIENFENAAFVQNSDSSNGKMLENNAANNVGDEFSENQKFAAHNFTKKVDENNMSSMTKIEEKQTQIGNQINTKKNENDSSTELFKNSTQSDNVLQKNIKNENTSQNFELKQASEQVNKTAMKDASEIKMNIETFEKSEQNFSNTKVAEEVSLIKNKTDKIYNDNSQPEIVENKTENIAYIKRELTANENLQSDNKSGNNLKTENVFISESKVVIQKNEEFSGKEFTVENRPVIENPSIKNETVKEESNFQSGYKETEKSSNSENQVADKLSSNDLNQKNTIETVDKQSTFSNAELKSVNSTVEKKLENNSGFDAQAEQKLSNSNLVNTKSTEKNVEIERSTETTFVKNNSEAVKSNEKLAENVDLVENKVEPSKSDVIKQTEFKNISEKQSELKSTNEESVDNKKQPTLNDKELVFSDKNTEKTDTDSKTGIFEPKKSNELASKISPDNKPFEQTAREQVNSTKISFEKENFQPLKNEKTVEIANEFNTKNQAQRTESKEIKNFEYVKNVAESDQNQKSSENKSSFSDSSDGQQNEHKTIHNKYEDKETATFDSTADKKVLEHHSEKTNKINPLLEVDTAKKVELQQPEAKTISSVDLKDVIYKIERMISNAAINKINNPSFTIDAKEYGKMEIKVKQENKEEQGVILVENHSIKQQMQKHIPDIQENLQQKGVNISAINVEVNSRNEENTARNKFSNRQNSKKLSGVEGSSHLTNIETTTNKTKNYGYNTMEILA